MSFIGSGKLLSTEDLATTSSSARHRLCCPSSSRSSSEQGSQVRSRGGSGPGGPCYTALFECGKAAVNDVWTPGVAAFQNSGLGKGGWHMPRSAAPQPPLFMPAFDHLGVAGRPVIPQLMNSLISCTHWLFCNFKGVFTTTSLAPWGDGFPLGP